MKLILFQATFAITEIDFVPAAQGLFAATSSISTLLHFLVWVFFSSSSSCYSETIRVSGIFFIINHNLIAKVSLGGGFSLGNQRIMVQTRPPRPWAVVNKTQPKEEQTREGLPMKMV